MPPSAGTGAAWSLGKTTGPSRSGDGETGRTLYSLPGHNARVQSVGFDAEGTRVVSAGGRTVRVWDARTGGELLVLKGHTGAVGGAGLPPDGKRIASASEDGTVKIWNAEAQPGNVAFEARIGTGFGHRGRESPLAFSPDGDRLASSGPENTIQVSDTETRRVVLRLRGHTDLVQCIAYTPMGDGSCRPAPTARRGSGMPGMGTPSPRSASRGRPPRSRPSRSARTENASRRSVAARRISVISGDICGRPGPGGSSSGSSPIRITTSSPWRSARMGDGWLLPAPSTSSTS